MKKDVRDFIVSSCYNKVVKNKEMEGAIKKLEQLYESISDKDLVLQIDDAMTRMAASEAKEVYILGFKAAFRKNKEYRGDTSKIKTTKKSILEIYWNCEEVEVTKEMRKTTKEFDKIVEKIKDKKIIDEIQDMSIELTALECREHYILGFKEGLGMINNLVA